MYIDLSKLKAYEIFLYYRSQLVHTTAELSLLSLMANVPSKHSPLVTKTFKTYLYIFVVMFFFCLEKILIE